MAFGGYTKLSSSILASTVWREPNETRIVWITMLALANAQGVVEASVPGLADLARVPLPACEEALQALQRPDRYSRTKEHEGRRIEPVDGGWLLLNYDRHRERVNVDERREYLRLAKQRSRQRASGDVNGCQHTSTKSTQAEAEAEAEASCSSSKSAAGAGAPPAVEHATPKRRKGERRTHSGHVSGLCDWICLPVRLREQFAAASGEDVSTPEKRSHVEGLVVKWAMEDVRAKWEGRQIGDGMWEFWKLRWREDFGTTDQREAWRARSNYQREMR